jgi:hypothetical protein
MNRNMSLLAILQMSIFLSAESPAQSDTLLPYPATNYILPIVSARVLEQPGGYYYSYSVGNRRDAIQSIHKFMVELKTPVKPESAPDDWTLWLMHYDTIDVAIWFSSDSVADIDEGELVSGFRFWSVGLPRISECWLRAWETVRGREGQYDPETAGIFMTSLRRSTIGPWEPADPFDALVFLDTLLSYTRQSAELGWLGRDRDNDCDDDERPDDGVVRNIEKRLEIAKRFLERQDSVKARKELEKLVQKVERIWKRSQDEHKKQGRDKEWKQDKSVMTSEAYALLKYNSEYLIDRLPQKEKPEKGKPKKERRD